ncbi:MAG: hypothetical protein JSV63_00300 [Candidatus Aenigmatarchaeota archaeon]|nr:MAG: hypothetical protein JSV63_00300 [Candidatus Aenigmarchaeota archaeon]
MISTSSRPLKAQGAFEFIFIFGLFLVAVSFAAFVSMAKTAEINAYERQLEVEDLLITVTEKINTVWIEGRGFSTNLTLPEKLTGTVYEINVTSNFVILKVRDEWYTRALITKNVSGTLQIGNNNLRHNGSVVVIS